MWANKSVPAYGDSFSVLLGFEKHARRKVLIFDLSLSADSCFYIMVYLVIVKNWHFQDLWYENPIFLYSYMFVLITPTFQAFIFREILVISYFSLQCLAHDASVDIDF